MLPRKELPENITKALKATPQYESTRIEANALRALLGFGNKPEQAAKPKKQPTPNNPKN